MLKIIVGFLFFKHMILFQLTKDKQCMCSTLATKLKVTKQEETTRILLSGGAKTSPLTLAL